MSLSDSEILIGEGRGPDGEQATFYVAKDVLSRPSSRPRRIWETAMAADLKEFLTTHKPKGFTPLPHYFASGDYLTFYLRDDRCYAKRIDDILTIYQSMADGEFVGCEGFAL